MKTNRRQAIALLGSTMLSACGAPAVVSRDKNDPFEGGIGGTGIVGTLNGFGSLRINGLTVELNSNSQIRTPFKQGSAELLSPGQVLTVSSRKNSGGILARDISIDYALVGELRRSGSAASVNGIPLVGWQDALGHGTPGQRVAISGTWTSSGVRPSRIDPSSSGPDLIAGTFDDGKIGNTPLSFAGLLPTDGTYAVAIGRMVHGGFEVEQIDSGRFAGFQSLALLSVDGYLEPSRAAPGFRIAGLGHSFAEDTRLGGIGTRRAIYFGSYSGRFDARRSYIVPDQFDRRQEILRDGLRDGGELDFIEI